MPQTVRVSGQCPVPCCLASSTVVLPSSIGILLIQPASSNVSAGYPVSSLRHPLRKMLAETSREGNKRQRRVGVAARREDATPGNVEIFYTMHFAFAIDDTVIGR